MRREEGRRSMTTTEKARSMEGQREGPTTRLGGAV